MPWRLVYSEEYKTREEALVRKKQLKRWENRERIESLIKNNNKRC